MVHGLILEQPGTYIYVLSGCLALLPLVITVWSHTKQELYD